MSILLVYEISNPAVPAVARFRRRNPDRTTFLPFSICMADRELGVPVILDYRDGWSADPYPARGIKDLIYREFARFVEPALFRRASAAVFISGSLRADHLSVIRMSGDDKAFVVPNGVDSREFDLAEQRDLKKDLGLPDAAQLFVYAGSLSPDIGADSFSRNLMHFFEKS